MIWILASLLLEHSVDYSKKNTVSWWSENWEHLTEVLDFTRKPLHYIVYGYLYIIVKF